MTHPLRSVSEVSFPFDAVLSLLLPVACVGCGTPPATLCGACRAALAPAPIAGPPDAVDWWTACWAYEGPVREAVVRAKYRGGRSGLRALVPDLARAAAAAPQRPAVVTWIPASRQRRADTGCDHAAILARGVARRLGVPVRRLLVRQSDPPQTGRSAGDRRRGPALRAAAALPAITVLVIDDVATTGASCASAAQALRGAGASAVVAATLARTPVRSSRVHR